MRQKGPPKETAEVWLRVSFHTKTDAPWATAGFEIARQQLQLEAYTRTDLHIVMVPPVGLLESGDMVRIGGTNFSATFSRAAGTLTSLKYDGREMIANGTATDPAGPVLQIYRAPTDNDRGFGRWLARDWRQAGLEHVVRRVDSFTVKRDGKEDVIITTAATSSATNGGFIVRTVWNIDGLGGVTMDSRCEPFGQLPLLPRIGVVMRVNGELDRFRWYGRGPHENYSDRKASAEVGLWSSAVNEQFVPYVRPQENGNKEDVRWLELTDVAGHGLHVLDNDDKNLISVSALHFTAADLAAARHNYELKPRPETILSLDAKQSGLGNGSCGPGVLEKYSVPAQRYRVWLEFHRAEKDGN
jgi:beta-galactosidase